MTYIYMTIWCPYNLHKSPSARLSGGHVCSEPGDSPNAGGDLRTADRSLEDPLFTMVGGYWNMNGLWLFIQLGLMDYSGLTDLNGF